uniref:Uncharacterized protein n=1 Tax=Cacopsylla melanoneura TaxID=428564 RepID=A0A8D8QC37_9HEMI
MDIAVDLLSTVISIGLFLSSDFFPSLLVLLILVPSAMSICCKIALTFALSYSILSLILSLLLSSTSKMRTFLALVFLSSISVITESMSLQLASFNFWFDSEELFLNSEISSRIDFVVSFRASICVFMVLITSKRLR